MSERRTIELSVAGQKYRVVSSAGEAEVQRLADVVVAKLKELGGASRAQPSQAMLLAAMALAHEVEAERGRREAVEARARDMLRRVLVRIDEALESCADSDG
ncbi:MAG TPA: cell division protein ZapA [Polyangiaceae bacterium]|jgi:cell division protein ZapA